MADRVGPSLGEPGAGQCSVGGRAGQWRLCSCRRLTRTPEHSPGGPHDGRSECPGDPAAQSVKVGVAAHPGVRRDRSRLEERAPRRGSEPVPSQSRPPVRDSSPLDAPAQEARPRCAAAMSLRASSNQAWAAVFLGDQTCGRAPASAGSPVCGGGFDSPPNDEHGTLSLRGSSSSRSSSASTLERPGSPGGARPALTAPGQRGESRTSREHAPGRPGHKLGSLPGAIRGRQRDPEDRETLDLGRSR